MADRLEVSKAAEFIALGPPADVLAVPKIAMFVVLVPGEDGSTPADSQAHVYAQVVGNN